jgi:hypothetical protein
MNLKTQLGRWKCGRNFHRRRQYFCIGQPTIQKNIMTALVRPLKKEPYLKVCRSVICGLSMQNTNAYRISTKFSNHRADPFNINAHYLDPDYNQTYGRNKRNQNKKNPCRFLFWDCGRKLARSKRFKILLWKDSQLAFRQNQVVEEIETNWRELYKKAET